MLSDPVADLLTRIRNGYLAKKKQVTMPHSKLKEAVVKLMADNDFVGPFKVTGKKPKLTLEVELKYDHRRPAINQVTRVSKPGVRIYASVDKLFFWRKRLGVALLSTPKGIMTADQAYKQKIGGEVICHIK